MPAKRSGWSLIAAWLSLVLAFVAATGSAAQGGRRLGADRPADQVAAVVSTPGTHAAMALRHDLKPMLRRGAGTAVPFPAALCAVLHSMRREGSRWLAPAARTVALFLTGLSALSGRGPPRGFA